MDWDSDSPDYISPGVFRETDVGSWGGSLDLRADGTFDLQMFSAGGWDYTASMSGSWTTGDPADYFLGLQFWVSGELEENGYSKSRLPNLQTTCWGKYASTPDYTGWNYLVRNWVRID